MKRNKVFVLMAVLLLCLTTMAGTAFAIEESEVQNAVDAASREQVSGNIFIWFLCAIAFLKVSQKIDSFMSSLGVNVGRTGGSMLAELMIAGRAIAGAAGAAGHVVSNVFTHNHGTTHAAAGQAFVSNQMGHGAIGMTQQATRNAAAAAATGQGKGLNGVMGSTVFQSSLDKGGQISNDVIHSVATGSISQMGLMTGSHAAQALTNYLGYNPGVATGGSSSMAGTTQTHSTAPSAPAGDSVTVMGGAAGGAQMPPTVGNQIPTAPDGSLQETMSPAGEDVITLNGGAAAAPQSVQSPTNHAEGSTPSSAGGQSIPNHTPIPSAPTFSKVEIGGGRITGYETPASGGEARQFAMYNANQYTEPTGAYETVKTVDGESWYKQYAQPSVEKTPKEVTDKGVKYDQKIVMQMPPVPKRKDKI